MIRIITTLLCLAAAPASAGPDRVSILIGSHHVDATLEFEEQNPGIFLTWEDRRGLDWSAGVFRNSFGGPSAAVTVALPLIRSPRFDLSAFAGVAAYPGHADRMAVAVGPFVPIGGLQLRADRLFIQIMPDRGDPAAVVAVGLTFPLE